MIEYKTKTGKNVQVYIETERENVSDHTMTSACHNFVVDVEGLGRLDVTLDGDVFRERSSRKINGKVVRIALPVSQEAAALYREYAADVARRIESAGKADREYLKHHNRVLNAMAE